MVSANHRATGRPYALLLIVSLAVLLPGTAPGADLDPHSDPEVKPYVDAPVSGYRLSWSDEFNGTSIDETKWNYRTDSKLWSTQLPANNSVSDGLYHIHLKKESAGGKEYTGGGVISRKLFRYGYYEARLKVPKGAGWHSSFWMMRAVKITEVPAGAPHIELDPMENDSSEPYHFQTDAHRWKPDPHHKYGTKQNHPASPLTEFHVFGLEFTPTELRYFFDGKLVSATDASQFEHNDVNIWLNCIAAKLGPKTTQVDDALLPEETQFDYVRYFKREAQSAIGK